VSKRKSIRANRDWPRGLDCVGNGAKLHSRSSQAQKRSIQLRFFSNQSKSLLKNPTGFRLRSQRLLDCELIFRKPNRSSASNNQLSNGIPRGKSGKFTILQRRIEADENMVMDLMLQPGPGDRGR